MTKKKNIKPITREDIKKLEGKELAHYEKMVGEELSLVKREKGNQGTPNEFLPPINMDDGFGNIMPHILINKKYIPKPIADVIVQEKRVVMEYETLKKMKNEARKYKEVGAKAYKARKKLK
jgi:hypothetical protein